MYSFDIFDTLITRRTSDPKGIFMLMQENLRKREGYPPFFSENFYELRIGAEELAREIAKTNGRQDVTIGEVYKALATAAFLTENQQNELEILEVETEYNNILGLTRNISLLKNLKSRGEHVVLISDMYLGERNIHYILSRIDPLFDEIPIYVSSDYGKTKGSGGLYQIVKSKEKASFSNWTHYGDNEYADIKPAAALGIKAIHLTPEKIAEYEQPGKDIGHQLSAGISKYIRWSGSGGTAREVGGSLAGPILYPYVCWVLRKSAEMGITRLYFVSRDGWILKQIADTIIQIEGYPVKTSYIYGSRRGWRLPCYDGSRDALGEIMRHSNMGEGFSLSDLAKLFQLSPEELTDFLPFQVRNIGPKEILSKALVDTISKWLQENERFRRYLVESQRANRELVLGYLRKEIDCFDDRYAFVELSGTGLTQLCLAKIIRTFYKGEVKNFFYHLDDIQEDSGCKFIQFCPNIFKRNFMLELLCRAPHGQVEGYKEENGKILPVLDPVEGEYIKDYHIEEYRDGVLAYVDGMEHAYIQNQLPYVPKLDLVREYMEVVAEHPPKRIAEYFCHMPFSSGGRKDSVIEFAPAISKKQLRKIYFWSDGGNARQIYHGDCLEYALAISGQAAKYKEKCQKYRENGIGRWLTDGYQYLNICQKPGADFWGPRGLLKGNIVIYGAGKVGQDLVRQARQKRVRCDNLLWVDSNYVELRETGIDVKSPEEIAGFPYDRIIIAVHNTRARDEIWEELQEMGVDMEKTYYG